MSAATEIGTPTFADYNDLPGLRWTRLRKLRTSPKAYREQVDGSAKHFEIGSAVHALLLAGPGVPQVVAATMRRDPRSSAWKDFQAENAGSIILTPADLDLCKRFAGAVRKHKVASEIIDRATEREKAITFTRAGRDCKCMFDLFGPGFFASLKTTRDLSSERMWGASVARLGYVHGEAWYRYGYEQRFTKRPDVFLIAVEKASPFDVRADVVEHDLLDVADREIDALLEQLAQHERENYWPGVAPKLGSVASYLPEWWADNDATSGFTIGGEEVDF